MERLILTANDGMVLTDGEIYGKEIYLADGVSPDAFHEITDAEYEEIVAEQMEKGDMEHILVENADMKAALNILGVE